nr:hypothetical protein Iba_chr10bCG4390 [Ipomoea batatas]
MDGKVTTDFQQSQDNATSGTTTLSAHGLTGTQRTATPTRTNQHVAPSTSSHDLDPKDVSIENTDIPPFPDGLVITD